MNEQLKVIIAAEIGKLKSGVSQAKSEIDKLGGYAKASAEKINAAFAKAGDGIKNGLSAAGTALAGLGAGLVASNVATEEYRVSMAKLTTSFNEVGLGSKAAKDTFGEFYGLLGETDTATEATALLGQLAKSEEELSQWTNIAAGTMATFPDSLPTESLIEAANETVKTGVVTGSLADAINWADRSAQQWSKSLSGNKGAQDAFNAAIKDGATVEDAFNAALAECSTEAERSALISAALGDAYGKTGEKFKEANAPVMEQRDAQLRLMETASKLGEAMAPVITAFMDFASSALQPVADTIAPLAQEYAPQLKDAMTAAGEAVGAAFGFFVDNWGIIAGIAGVIGGIAAAIGLYNAVAAIKAAMDALQVTTLAGLIAAQWAAAASAAAALAPYLAIVAVIALIVAGIVLLVKNWDDIKAKVKEVAQAIKEKVQEMLAAVKEKFNAIKQAISEKIDGAKQAVKNKFNEIKNAIKTAIDTAKQTVSNVFNAIKNTISNVVTGAVTTVKTKFNNIKDAIKTAIDAAKNTVSNVFNSIKSTISNVVGGAVSTVKTKFNSIKTSISTAINGARDAVKNAIDKIKGFFNFSFSWPHIPLPHFSVSPAGWKVGDLLKGVIPSLGIRFYAKGGVFDSPTLFNDGRGVGMLGEKGAEAILPLEDHPKWIKALAKELMSQGNSRPIILKLDKKTIAEEVVDGINEWTRAAGSSPLRVM